MCVWFFCELWFLVLVYLFLEGEENKILLFHVCCVLFSFCSSNYFSLSLFPSAFLYNHEQTTLFYKRERDRQRETERETDEDEDNDVMTKKTKTKKTKKKKKKRENVYYYYDDDTMTSKSEKEFR